MRLSLSRDWQSARNTIARAKNPSGNTQNFQREAGTQK
uniref:Uncharacterized protein n=1 Tax=Anguilla anguilla TaxID=7936 RepID=A0A0E9R614_ANGAN